MRKSLGLHRPVLNGKVNFPLCLAPMVGLTHVALREVMREYLPQDAYTIWPTEMLNSRRIPDENLEKTPEMVAKTAKMVAANAVHLAGLLKRDAYPG